MDEAAKDKSRRNEYSPINRGKIREQLSALASRSSLWGSQDDYDDTRADVLLTWPAGQPSPWTVALCLGHYPKWLILLDMVFDAYGGDLDLKQLLEAAGHETLTNQILRNIFDPTAIDKGLKEPSRYDPTAPRKKDRKHDEEDVLEAILGLFNAHQTKERKPEIELERFARHDVKLQQGSDVVGARTIERFKHWLVHQRAMANPAVDSRIAASLPEILVSQAKNFVHEFLTRNSKYVGHRVVANFTGSASDGTLGRFSAALKAVLADSAHDPDLPYVVVIASLAAGASRRKVLKSLYEQVCPDRKVPTDIDNRAIDLSLDLEEIRDSLTISPVVVIFEDWDNNAGPFGSLRDFICDSHWGEFIRSMIQPVQARLLASARPPQLQARIVVLSSAVIEDLDPWTSISSEISSSHAKEELDATVDQEHQGAETGRASPTRHGSANVPIHQVHQRHAIDAGDERNPIFGYLTVALRLVAASVNGMQRATLQRCLKQWVMLFGWTPNLPPRGTFERANHRAERIEAEVRALEDSNFFERMVGELLKRHAAVIWEVDDEELEGLSNDTRASELDRRPMAGSPSNESGVQRSIQFRSRELNASFLNDWPDVQSLGADVADQQFDEPDGWPQLNFILAEESLRQATVQMRHLQYSVRESAQSSRRFIEAIHHGLACAKLDVVPVLESGIWAGSLYDTTLPLEAKRRYKYLYSFLYRQCVEDGDWRLGRAFGRSDVRLDLLTMFTVPSSGHLMLSATSQSAGRRLLPPVYRPEEKLPAGGPALRSDLLEALGRAGLDAGTRSGRDAVEWVLSVLPGWRLPPHLGTTHGDELQSEKHAINSRLPPRDQGYQEVANAALKLRLDWLQSSGSDTDLPMLIELGRDQLQRMGIDPAFLDRLPALVTAVIAMARDGAEGVTTSLFGTLSTALETLTSARHTASSSMIVSDVLYRLAEAYATQADNDDFGGRSNKVDAGAPLASRDALLKFAQACAVYWLADRMRAIGGAQDDSGIKWPTAGGRGTRYYIRVCMKLARLILDGASLPHARRATGLALALLDHAQSRLGLFTRHHFRFDRERVSGLLLESARIRSWVRVTSEQVFRSYRQEVRSQTDQLAAAVSLNAAAKEQVVDARRQVENMKRTQRQYQRIIPLEQQQNQSRLEEFERKLARCERIAIRTRESVEMEEARIEILRKHCLDQIRVQHEILQRSLNYLDEAERLLLALGFQSRHVRRLFLERAKFASTMVKHLSLPDDAQQAAVQSGGSSPSTAAQGEAQAYRWAVQRELVEDELRDIAQQGNLFGHLRIASLALMALSATSRHDPFWKVIHDRQRISLSQATSCAEQRLRTKTE